MQTDFSLAPIRRARLSQQIMVEICRMIRETKLQPGDRLPGEREFAEQLGVSRAPVREALRALEIAGLVESRHGGGTYVRDILNLGLDVPLALALEASDDTVGDLWEVRVLFEPEIAARAALRATEDDLSALAANIERLRAVWADLNSSDTALRIDREFHAGIARASHNRVSLRVIAMINQLLHESRTHFATSPERRELTLHRHSEILECLVAGDAQCARERMLLHLVEIEAFILGEVIKPDDQATAK
jgi:GntR family transcriptional repressor for pyruvate dehydrogenase complex